MKISILIIVSLFLCSSPVLQAQGVTYNQEFQVNTYTNSWQSNPSVGYLTDGGFVVCWSSFNQDGSVNGIYGQLYNNDGTRLDSEFQVNTYTTSSQSNQSIANLADSRFVVCWDSYGQDGNDFGIYGQFYNNDGSKRDSEFQVNTYTIGRQFKPSVSSLADGGFAVCWQSEYQDGSGYGIYGQLYNSDGSRRGSEFQVNTFTNNWQANPRVSNLTDCGFVVCWNSQYQDGSWSGIYSQLFNSDGSRRGTEFQVNTYIDNFQDNSSISNLSNGRFVICWDSFGQDGSGYGIYGQLFNSDGTKRDSEFKVNTYISSDQSNPSVANLSDGGFVVCWESWQDGHLYGIYSQLFNSDGSMRGTEFQVNTYINDDQLVPSVSNLSDGGFIVCWSSSGQDGSESGIYGKYYLKEINHQLEQFSLLEPAYDMTINTTKPTFKWKNATSIRINLPWELEYYFYLDETDDFNSPRIFPAIYDTTCTVGSLSPGTTYFWKVLAKNLDGNSLWSSETNGFFVSHDATTIEENDLEKPESFKLLANYPNPFNPETTIKYVLPRDKAHYNVKIKIYNALGQLVVALKDEQQKPGVYTLKWNGQNTAGQAMPSGVYFCVVQAGQFKAVQKMLLVR